MKSRKGASTILVLFMIIVLITLGLFTIVSANANYKLSKKSNKWSSTYYAINKVCELDLAEIEEVLAISEQDAVSLTLESFDSDNSFFESIKCYTANADIRISNEDLVYNFLNNKYKFIALDKLSALAAKNGYSTVSVEYNDDNTISNLEYSMIVKSNEDENYEIQVVLDIRDILYSLYAVDGQIVGEKMIGKSRVDIKKWKQYQNIVQKTNGIEIWDPRENMELDIISPKGDVGGTWNPTEEIEIVE